MCERETKGGGQEDEGGRVRRGDDRTCVREDERERWNERWRERERLVGEGEGSECEEQASALLQLTIRELLFPIQFLIFTTLAAIDRPRRSPIVSCSPARLQFGPPEGFALAHRACTPVHPLALANR